MKALLVTLLLASAATGAAEAPGKKTSTECASAKACLALARTAIAKRQWQEAETWAAYALDWAEPRDAQEALTAYRLAAESSVLAKRPRMAMAWTAAGLRYAGPWAPGSRRISESHAAVETQAQLERIHRSLERKQVEAEVMTTPGYFVQYAGRGVWNEVILEPQAAGGLRWSINAYRVGLGLELVRSRGPAQMSEGNSGVASSAGKLLRIEYGHAADPSVACTATIQFTKDGLRLESVSHCAMGNVGVSPWGEYRRVEAWK